VLGQVDAGKVEPLGRAALVVAGDHLAVGNLVAQAVSGLVWINRHVLETLGLALEVPSSAALLVTRVGETCGVLDLELVELRVELPNVLVNRVICLDSERHLPVRELVRLLEALLDLSEVLAPHIRTQGLHLGQKPLAPGLQGPRFAFGLGVQLPDERERTVQVARQGLDSVEVSLDVRHGELPPDVGHTETGPVQRKRYSQTHTIG